MKFIICLVVAYICTNLYAEEAWEREDLVNQKVDKSDVFLDFGIKFIELYQNRIAVNSVSRCPFYTSCSHYTIYAIKKYGLLSGTLFFIDRNLYRENPDIYKKYIFSTDINGTMKINDDFYIGK